MPLTDLRNVTPHNALQFTFCFGLNRSQGNYFYDIVQKSPPGTYLADLKHISQPPSTSLLGRLLREACGTPPQLIPQEPVREQSCRAWYDFEIKYGPSRVEASMPHTTVPSDQKAVNEAAPPVPKDPLLASAVVIREPGSSPLPATQPSFATLPPQLSPLSIPVPPETPLGRSDIRQYPHPYGTTDTQPSFTLPTIDGSNLPPQYLFYYSNGTSTFSEPIQQDDMDCLPPSPFLSSDVDMDILTDTAPAPPSYDYTPWTHWIPLPEYVPQPVSTWQTPVQEPPPSANQYCSGFTAPTPLYTPSLHTARDNLPGDSTVSVTSAPRVDFSHENFVSAYHSCPLELINAASGQIQDTVGNESQNCGSTSHSTIVATLLDELRSLTLVADETPSFDADSRSNYSRHPEPTSACIIESEPTAIHRPQTNVPDALCAALDRARSNDGLDNSKHCSNSVFDADRHTWDDSPPFEREAMEPPDESKDGTLACFLNVHDSLPRPSEREPTEPLEDDQGQPPGDPLPPQFEREATEPLEGGEDQPPPCFQPGRPLDPASISTDFLAAASVMRPARRVVHPLDRPRPPTPPPSRRLAKPGLGRDTSTNQCTTRPATNANANQQRAGVRAGKARYGRNRREGEEAEGEEEREVTRPNRRERTKRTRFVVPDAEDEGEEDSAARLLPYPHRTRGTGMSSLGASSNSPGPRRTTVTGPLRSILRNARATAMPYQKAGMRHAGRRASVP